MLENAKNTKAQGDIGEAAALLYFNLQDFPVSIPFGDNQRYDLIVEFPEGLKRVQVKTTRYKKKTDGKFEVALRTRWSDRNKTTTRFLDDTEIDLLFIYTAEGDIYLIPSKDLTAKSALILGEKYKEYHKGRLGMSEPTSL